MCNAKRSFLLLAATIGLLAPNAAQGDEVTMQLTRTIDGPDSVQTVTTTTTSSAGVPVQTVVTGTPYQAVVEGTPVQTITTERQTVVTSGEPAGAVVVTGSPIPLAISEAQDILRTVDLRRAALDKAIVDARVAGTISEGQAAAMRRELDRIGSEVAVLKQQPSPSLLRSIVVAQDLDALTVNLKTSVNAIALVPIIEGSHFTIFNGRIIQLDDLAVRRIELENKILAAQAAGRINFDEANHMRSELNAIAALEDAYKSDGTLSFKNGRHIYRDMDNVANELDRAMR
jgi:hypothetical protein